MVASMSIDRLNAAFGSLLNLFLGRDAVKQVDACARYWGVVAKVSGAKIDVTLDTTDIPSPSGVPLYLGIPSSSVSDIEGMRVLVGFRNGDLSQPFVDDFEQAMGNAIINIGQTSPKGAARKGDDITASSALATWAAAVEAGIPTGTPPVTTFAAAAGIAGGLSTIHGGSDTVNIGD